MTQQTPALDAKAMEARKESYYQFARGQASRVFKTDGTYQGRHGELQISDSVAADTVRFMAVDGAVEPRIKFAATGLDPKLTGLFADGRRIKQRRLMYWPDYIASPFYKHRTHIIENGDLMQKPKGALRAVEEKEEAVV